MRSDNIKIKPNEEKNPNSNNSDAIGEVSASKGASRSKCYRQNNNLRLRCINNLSLNVIIS